MNERYSFIDYMKGLGIILMVMGHVGYGRGFDYYIHAFHMPLFFLISGYLWQESKLNIFEFLKKKGRSLLAPYVFFNLIYFVFYVYLQHGSQSFMEMAGYYGVRVLFPTMGIPIAGALWFLPALFGTELITFVLTKMHLGREGQTAAAVVVTAVGMLFPLSGERLPLGLDISMAAFGFYRGGVLIKEWQRSGKMEWLVHMNGVGFCAFFLVNMGAIFFNGYVNMMDAKYAFPPLSWINAFAAFLFLFYITQKWEAVSRIKDIRILKILERIGRDSIVYVLMNQYCIFVLTVVLEAAGIKRGILVRIVMTPVVMIMLRTAGVVMNLPGFRSCIGKK